MNHSQPSPRIEKTAARFRSASPGTRFGWPDVLRAIQDDEARARVVARLRDAGLSPDDIVAPRRYPRVVLLEAIVAEEDRLEREHPRRHEERSTIREMRRRLECEVWP